MLLYYSNIIKMNITITENEELKDGFNPEYSENMTATISKRLPDFVAQRSGARTVIAGPPASGKSYLVNALFSRKPRIYRGVFNRVYLFIPSVSFDSLERSPFLQLADLGRVYHDINDLALMPDILTQNKNDHLESCIIVDDFGNEMRERDVQNNLNRLMMKSRHYRCQIILLNQSIMQLPREVRRLVTVWHIYKFPRSDFYLLMNELLGRHSVEYWDQLYEYVYERGPYKFLTVQTETNPPRLYMNGHLLSIE